jgi:PAS domain-containing protein
VEITTRQATYCRASVGRGDRSTKLEWVIDSAFRFFPVEPDLDLGWRLNFWDAATNKVLALAGRTVLRDYLDVLYLHEWHLHLGALAWAAAGKDPGLTPEMILDGARRNTRFPDEDLSKLYLAQPADFKALKRRFLQAADEAESLFQKLPLADVGCFYLDSDGKPVYPNPAASDFARLTRHCGCVKGAWPRVMDE